MIFRFEYHLRVQKTFKTRIMKKVKLTCFNRCIFLLIIFICFSIFTATADSERTHNTNKEKEFKAGAATSNITPALGGVIVGGWGSPEAEYIHDELHARCLVLDDGSTRLVFIVADLLGLHQYLTDEAKRIIFEETRIPPQNVIISAIHTHSATSAMGEGDKRRQWNADGSLDDYQKFIVRRFADVVKIAIQNLEPAQIGWGAGSVPEHVFVRRWIMKEPVINPFGEYDKVMMNPGNANENKSEPAGVPDPDVSFISVQSLEGKPIALLANYSLHYVGGVPQGHISADYFAVFANRMKELLKADQQNIPFVGIMTNGTSGDVNNINYAAAPEKNQPYQKMNRVAEDVAREVFRALGSIRHQPWVPLQGSGEMLKLAVRKPYSKMTERARAVLDKPETEKPLHRHEKIYANRLLYLLDWPDTIAVELQVFKIGDLGIASIPFETFAETGLEIKAKSKMEQTFTIELANGYYGYLPTPRQHDLGGYETWLGTNMVEKEASVKITDALLRMLSETSN